MAFMDRKKEYDTILRQQILEALEVLNINSQILEILQEIYRHMLELNSIIAINQQMIPF